MAKFVHHIDLNENQIRNAKFDVHSSDPLVGQFDGWTIYHSAHKTIKVYAGGDITAWRSMLYNATSSTNALTITNNLNGTLSMSIANVVASGDSGLMTGADKQKLDDASSTAVGTLVLRDGSGNFTGGTITATTGFSGNLTGNVLGDVTGNVTGQVSDLSNHDTGDLAEGTNLYYTDTRVRANRLDQMAAPTASVSMNSQRLTSVATPVDDTDAANKAYVDAARTGLDVKASVRAASTPAGGNITLSGEQTIDGVALVSGDRVLIKDQTAAAENGIYVVAAGSWSRAADADSNSPNAEVTGGMFTFVEEGTTNADSGWVLTTNGTPNLGVDDLDFALFSVAGNILAGDGLSKTGDVLAVNVDNSTIEINSDSLRIKASGVTETHLNTSVAGSGLSGGAGSPLAINILSTGGLQITSDDLGIKLDTNSALSLSANGLTVNSSIAGAGLTWTNGVLSVDSINLASGVTGILPVANGGTNASTASGARASLDVPRKYVAYAPSGSTSATITHNLGTSDIIVQVYEVSTGETVFTDVERKDSGGTLSNNDVTLTFSVAPSSNQYRVVIAAVE